MPIMCLLHYRPIPQILCFCIPFPKRQLALLRTSSQISLCFTLPPYLKSTSTISLSTSNRSSLRADVLRHIRLPVQTLTPTASRAPSQWSLLQLFSLHEDHLTRRSNRQSPRRCQKLPQSRSFQDATSLNVNTLVTAKWVPSSEAKDPVYSCQSTELIVEGRLDEKILPSSVKSDGTNMHL
ncbi:hypothetical protein ES288_D11G064600v1 [Gossypium darwinii]|uniref:Uncharacterized protein n=1 Tax=Gossypium darwinii TaxID=34276 RepID=A0A5D2AGS3_GOSDA|nr:hypothetical protein ES288_D11G064600v1 [Gossypium darwinii]